MNAASADEAVRWGQRGTPAILDRLRANLDKAAKPPGVPMSGVLVDAVIHAIDIRKPLGKPRDVPADTFVAVADAE